MSNIIKTKKAIFLLSVFLIGILSVMFGPAIAEAAENVTTYMIVTIGNTAPKVIQVLINPDPADPNSNIEVAANVTDDNGQSDIVLVNVSYFGAGGENYNYVLTYVSGNEYRNNSLILPNNATPGTWYANVTAIDATGATGFNHTTFTVNAIVAIELINTPINFSTVSAGTTDNPALQHLQINNTGNTFLNYTIEGLDLVGVSDPGYNIGVGNVTVDSTDTYDHGDEQTLSTSAQLLTGGTIRNPPSLTDVNFHIDVPSGLLNQDYKGNLTIRAVQS